MNPLLRYGPMPLPQLRILQEVITLSVFVPFAAYYMKQPLKLDYLWASLCIMGAVYFMFRGYRLAWPAPRSRLNFPWLSLCHPCENELLDLSITPEQCT